MISQLKGVAPTEDVWEQSAEGNIWS